MAKTLRRQLARPRGLCLTRRQSERVICELPHGDEIVVTVTATSRKRTKLHIAAPTHIPIVRGELRDAEDAEREEAAA